MLKAAVDVGWLPGFVDLIDDGRMPVSVLLDRGGIQWKKASCALRFSKEK